MSLTSVILDLKGNKQAHKIKNKLCRHIGYLTFDTNEVEKNLIKKEYHDLVKYYVDHKKFDVIFAQDQAYILLGGDKEYM